MSEPTDRLRQVAEQATPGPWRPFGRWVRNHDDYIVGEGWRQGETHHIATFDPVLVAAMLDVIDTAEQVALFELLGFFQDRLDGALERFWEVAE